MVEHGLMTLSVLVTRSCRSLGAGNTGGFFYL
nr:MAG TPA: hypothetical protein [Caudoviricetes sp.]